MSDKDEPSVSKRLHDSDSNRKEGVEGGGEDDECSDDWVGPLPTDAAPAKKRKGIPLNLNSFVCYSICKLQLLCVPFLLIRVLPYEKLYLENLPDAECYEKSYMHRDVVTHVIVTKTDFVVTASIDGHLKFWKKMEDGIEFVKHFRGHLCT